MRTVAAAATSWTRKSCRNCWPAVTGTSRWPATSREREVLALMAEGHSNAGIASRLVVTEKAVNKHIGNIFTKLGLYPDEDANRRVLAVLTYLNA